MPQYRPDTSIKLTIWTTPEMKKLVDRICDKWEAFEADVLRVTLEAMVPQCLRSGFAAFLSERQMDDLATPFSKKESDRFSMKLTVRTSAATKRGIKKLTGRSQSSALRDHSSELSQAEAMRFAYQAGLPLALRRGMSHLLALREKEIARTKRARKRLSGQ